MQIELRVTSGLSLRPEDLVEYWNSRESLRKMGFAQIKEQSPVAYGNFKTCILIPLVVGLSASVLHDEIKAACDNLRVPVCVHQVVSEQTGQLLLLILSPPEDQEEVPHPTDAIPLKPTKTRFKNEKD